MKLHYSALRGKILSVLLGTCTTLSATAQNFNPGTAPEYNWPSTVGTITHTCAYSGMMPLKMHTWDDPASSTSGIAWTDYGATQGFLNYPTGVRDLEISMMDWPGSLNGSRIVVAYYNTNTNMGVTGMGIGGSGAALTPGHYFDEFDWMPGGGLTWVNTTQLSTMSNYTRISIAEHLSYAMAIAWQEPTGIHVIARETSAGWGPITTLTGTVGETYPDIAFSHTPATGTPGIRFVYHKSVKTPPDEQHPTGSIGVRITESYVAWGSIIPPFSGTTIAPTIEDLNILPWTFADYHTHIDCPDHDGNEDWSYSYVDPARNKVYVRVMDFPTNGGSVVTHCLNDGSLAPTTGIDQQFGGPVTNNWPVVSYEQMGSPTGAYELYTAWHTYFDNSAGPAPFPASSGQYVGMKITPNGTVTSSIDYIEVPSNPLTAMSTPGINFSKNNEQPTLYIMYAQIDAGGTNIIQTKQQPWTNVAYRHAETPEEHAAKLAEATNIYPSPFRDNLNIAMPSEMMDNELNINITDVKGALVKSFTGKGSDAGTFLNNIAGKLSPGIYLVNIKTSFINYDKTFKVQKQD